MPERLTSQLQAGEPVDELGQRDATFEASEAGPEAVVDPSTKRQVGGPIGTAEVELIDGWSELFGISVGCTEAGQHEVARLEGLA